MEGNLPSAQGLYLSKPWGLLLSPAGVCSLKTLTQVRTVGAVRIQQTQKSVSRFARLARGLTSGLTGLLILGHEHQVQQNEGSWSIEHVLLSPVMIIHYTVLRTGQTLLALVL